MEVTEKLFPLPKVPLGIEMVAWQLHSGGLTASPSSQGKMLHTSFTMPVIAKELEDREYCSGIFFPTFHHFPRVES